MCTKIFSRLQRATGAFPLVKIDSDSDFFAPAAGYRTILPCKSTLIHFFRACGGLKALFYKVNSAAGEKFPNSPCKTAIFPSKIPFFAPAASPKWSKYANCIKPESNY